MRTAGQTGKDAATNTAKAASAKLAAAGTDALKTDAANTNVPQADALKAADGTKSDANGNAAPAPTLPASAHDAAPAPTAQSSASGQSANTSIPSVAATVVLAPANMASSASGDVTLQVAPQHRDATSTSTMDTLGLTIAAKSAEGIKHFDIRLDPPELGRVEIHLSLDNSGKAQANLVVDKPQTLELLQRDAANLTHSLNDAGVSLSNNGLNFSLRGQDRQTDSGSVVKGRSRALSVKAVVGTDAISNSSSIASLAPDSVRLDIRV
jgi:flagellar hook-length control protein FliK